MSQHLGPLCAPAREDWGTYRGSDAEIDAQKAELAADNRFVPQGGETCNDCYINGKAKPRELWSGIVDRNENRESHVQLRVGREHRHGRQPAWLSHCHHH